MHCISGWDRTPLFISLIRLSLWAVSNRHNHTYLSIGVCVCVCVCVRACMMCIISNTGLHPFLTQCYSQGLVIYSDRAHIEWLYSAMDILEPPLFYCMWLSLNSKII